MNNREIELFYNTNIYKELRENYPVISLYNTKKSISILTYGSLAKDWDGNYIDTKDIYNISAKTRDDSIEYTVSKNGIYIAQEMIFVQKQKKLSK